MDELSACGLAKAAGLGDGTMLVTRAYGRQFLIALDAELRWRPDSSVVALDFRGVSVMDGSFADEAFGVYAAHRDVHGRPGCLLLLNDLPPHVDDTLEITLGSRPTREPGVRNCALPIRRSGRVELLGKVEQHVRESFELLRIRRSLTARDLVGILGLDIHAASTRLKVLYTQGLALRAEEHDPHGRMFVYGWPF